MFWCRTSATSYGIIGSSHWIGQHSIFSKISTYYRDTLKPKAYLVMEWGTFTDVLPCEAPTSVGFQLPAQWLGKFRQTEMGSPHVFLFSQGAENSCFIYFVHLYFCLCCQCNDTIIVTFSRLEPRDSTILCELEVGLHLYTNLLT